MAEKMQYCFNCGVELGIYETHSDYFNTCGSKECERAAREAYAEQEAEATERARADQYDHYR